MVQGKLTSFYMVIWTGAAMDKGEIHVLMTLDMSDLAIA